jgi:LmbE family N-acetylglucosaminyl deacetylase
LLVGYDQAGGYGHRDHLQVHQVGSLAAELTGIRTLEATRPREQLVAVSRALRPLRIGARYNLVAAHSFGTPRSQLTHRVNVRRYAAQKQAALAAHASQAWPASSGRSARLFWLLVRLPVPIFGLLLGTEWFAEPRLAARGRYRDHVLN